MVAYLNDRAEEAEASRSSADKAERFRKLGAKNIGRRRRKR